MKIEPVRMQLSRSLLREWRRGDEPSLVRHANNRNIWINVRDTFPHPYTPADARSWIRLAGPAPFAWRWMRRGRMVAMKSAACASSDGE